MTKQNRIDWLRLARTENVGPVTFHQLVARYGSATAALDAIPELAARGGLKRKLTIPSVSAIEDEIYRTQKAGAHVLLSCEAEYPHLLRAISDAPPALTFQGHINLLHKPCVAMVGARNASLNGRRFAEKLARELGEAGFVVISGLAAGIDAAAHVGALKTGTVGIVAGGIDKIYPPENAGLHDSLREQGCIVAEMPVGTQINAGLFLRRNRLVSSLARGVVVVEASLRSGSLVTARLAGEQGREVMAVPGSPLDARAAGTNRLIKDGATLIESAADAVAAIGNMALQESEPGQFSVQPYENKEICDDTQLREQLIEAMGYSAVPVDELVRLCQRPTYMVLAAILELELAGRLTRLPGNQVVLVTPAAATGSV